MSDKDDDAAAFYEDPKNREPIGATYPRGVPLREVLLREANLARGDSEVRIALMRVERYMKETPGDLEMARSLTSLLLATPQDEMSLLRQTFAAMKLEHESMTHDGVVDYDCESCELISQDVRALDSIDGTMKGHIVCERNMDAEIDRLKDENEALQMELDDYKRVTD